jgi:cysteinyl-tRNA synthetase
MHNGMIQLTGEKMAKSAGNIALLHEIVGEYGRETVVMYLISGHYRQPLAFSKKTMEQAQANVKRIREAGRRLGPGPTQQPAKRRSELTEPEEFSGQNDDKQLQISRDGFFEALANDFNTAGAMAQLNEWIRAAESLGFEGYEDLAEMLGVLGLQSLLDPPQEAPAEVRRMAEERMTARSLRDFAAADRLRDEIAARGWEVRDVAGGFELLPL